MATALEQAEQKVILGGVGWETYERPIGLRAKVRVDLAVDPPPDLAIEIDITALLSISCRSMRGEQPAWTRCRH